MFTCSLTCVYVQHTNTYASDRNNAVHSHAGAYVINIHTHKHTHVINMCTYNPTQKHTHAMHT